MRPSTLLTLLVALAVAAGAFLQARQGRSAATSAAVEDLQQEVSFLQNEIEILRRENEALRSLVQGGGEISPDPALIEFAENALGLDFLSTPVVHQTTSEALVERVTASIESHFPPNSLDHRQQAWTLLGLLQPDDRFAPQLAATRALGARSWFDSQTGDAWVTDRFDAQSVPDQAALLRVLVRILLHQHFPPPASHPGDEADRAREALHHGTAISIENRFLARQALGLGFTGTQVDSGAAELLGSLPVFIQGLATFPSLLGTPRAERLLDQEEILQHLHSPPAHTSWFFPGQEEKIPATPQPATAPEGSTPVLDESLGMLGLQLWLQTLEPDLAPLASLWKGDRFQLTARSDSQLDLRWTLELETESAALELAPAFLAMTGYLAQSEEDPEFDRALVTPEGRQITASHQGARLALENLAAE